MNLDDAIARFERRSTGLTRWARFFLSLVVLLLGAGAAAVWFAPNITASDIGPTSYEKKMAAIGAARAKGEKMLHDLMNDAARAKCRENILMALKNWAINQSVDTIAIRLEDLEIPTGDSILKVVDPVAKRTWMFGDMLGPDPKLPLRLSVPSCRPPSDDALFYFSVPHAKWTEFANAMRGLMLAPAPLLANIAEIKQVTERLSQLDKLADQAGLERLQDEVGGLKEQPAAPSSGKDDLFVRLLQTSITRFGLLAVVGFFVSILVSLYKYNVRLAAFYMARADVLRLCAPNITISDFALIATILSPTVEFGKAPQPPLGQLLEMAKTVKEAGK